MTRKYLILLLLATVVAGTLVWKFILNNNEEPAASSATPEISQTQQDTEQEANQNPDDENNDSDNEEEPVTDEPKQSTGGLPTSESKPTVNTGSGHSSESPLPLNRLTSTLCTATAGSKCKIQFVNATSGKTIEFVEKEVLDDGFVSWEWKGSDVGSGTWNVYAVSGSKKSDKEVIYIQ